MQIVDGIWAGIIITNRPTNDQRKRQPLINAAALAAILLLLTACATISRLPLSAVNQAYLPGIPNARYWTDDASQVVPLIAARPISLLALSGGGAEGAFGAGFLKGWSASGQRLQFDVVSGTSVGALMAPFAFLGPNYDHVLETTFTGGMAEGLLSFDGVNAVFGSGVYNTRPLREFIARFTDMELLNAIAAEYRKGRLLFVATTDLDAQRTAIWNLGAIAASNAPERLSLFRTILTASTAIPGVFSPVFIEVEANGVHYSEMHVDGSVSSSVFAIPEGILIGSRRAPANSQVYIIVNGKLSPDSATTDAAILPIVMRSFWTTVKSNTRNAILATHEFCVRNKWRFHLTGIDQAEPIETLKINFETAYMRRLFNYGYEKGKSGHGFKETLDVMKAQ